MKVVEKQMRITFYTVIGNFHKLGLKNKMMKTVLMFVKNGRNYVIHHYSVYMSAFISSSD